jgi:hypothetical protein
MSSFNKNKKRRVDDAVGINSTPTNKDIVTLLCANITTTQDQDGTTWCMSECPAHNDGKFTVKWKKGFGYSNPHSKLKTCFGGEEKLLAAYRSVYKAKDHSQMPNIHDAINQAAGFTAEETALTNWLNMIIVKNWALSSVECKMHRNMCKHKPTFSKKHISMMIFILGEVVESKITKMLLYLKKNCNFWDINDVHTALKRLKENEKTARFEARLVAFNQEEDQIMADMETLNPTDNDE